MAVRRELPPHAQLSTPQKPKSKDPGALRSDASAQFHGRVKVSAWKQDAHRVPGTDNLALPRESNISPGGFRVLREARPLLMGGGSQASPELLSVVVSDNMVFFLLVKFISSVFISEAVSVASTLGL